MRFIAHDQARVAVRYLPDDLVRPENLTPRELIAVLANTYKFAGGPRLDADWANNPKSLSFKMGECLIGETKIAITQLDIMTDGAVVGTMTTDQGDMVLDHLTTLLLAMGYKIHPPRLERSYFGTLVVEFETGVDNAIPQLMAMNDAINSAFRKTIKVETPAQLFRLGFGCDNTKVRAAELTVVAEFLLERRANHPFETNRYFSGAPLPNKAHIEVLEKIERILLGKKV